MDNFIINHINKLHQESLSDEGIKSLNILESEIGILVAELKIANEQLERNRYVTIPEATIIMNISRKRLDEIIRNSEIPVVKYSAKAILIDMADIRNYIESKKVFYTNNKEAEKGENKA